MELPPRYRIEFILFAHGRFDETEEYFDVVPPTSQFAAPDGPVPMRLFDEDSRQALQELIEGPISFPPPEEPEPDPLLDLLLDPLPEGELVLEAYLDPRLVEGPNTRYLELEELTLLPMLERLENIDTYTPLLHSGWEQNGLPEDDAVPVNLEEFGATNPRGTIRLHMSRYLHISVDLAYRNEPLTSIPEALPEFGDLDSRPIPAPAQPAPSPTFGFTQFETSEEPEEPAYFLLEERRILREELNYFDHPAFGLLLQITLAPEPESEPGPDADGPSA